MDFSWTQARRRNYAHKIYVVLFQTFLKMIHYVTSIGMEKSETDGRNKEVKINLHCDSALPLLTVQMTQIRVQ